MAGPRFDSLFARLLLAQSLLAVALFTVFGVVYVRDRNKTVAAMAAAQWAPALAAATSAASPTPDTPLSPLGGVRRLNHRPPGVDAGATPAPRLRMFQRELQARGVAVHRLAFDPDEQPQRRLWLELRGADERPLWLGIDAPFLAPGNSTRLLLGLALGGALVIALSWALARRLTAPLTRLHRRIAGGPGAVEPAPMRRAPPEVAEIEQAYHQLLARLQAQQAERSLLLAGVSHDLRSPLGRIRLAAELLPASPDCAPRQAAIVRNVAVADRLIESFLDLVRSEQLALDEPVDLADAARRVAASFECDAAVLQVTAPRSLELPRAHQHLVERALFNLIDNALKHGRPPVRLTVSAAAPGEARVEVMDHGPGMPDTAARLRALQAFSRGDGSRQTAGSGLGLTVVQQVATRLGGQLEFDGGPGSWCVRLRLPAGPAGEPR
ncbi:sensor histidine kinase [Eleftheria terrae]|uniref:sensor histidine kinase n=1 Tax=Eleftheria terrae TaxID=1597781 RepID=UPI00263B0609|nr:HAMP domain-containing sensor histidine kinase [Eleftheria terrae]WKB54451.1 HAMP domain-containing histidine kinase [Eleftheria terrae]